MLGWRHYLRCRVMSSLPYIHAWMMTWEHTGKVVTTFYYWSIWRILAPAAKVFTMRDFLKNSTGPCEAIESWKRSLAQFLDEQEAKQKWRHYPTVTTLPHLYNVQYASTEGRMIDRNRRSCERYPRNIPWNAPFCIFLRKKIIIIN